MKKFTMLSAILSWIMICTQCFSQNTFPPTGATGIGTTSPDISSLLEIKSTTQGLLIPRMTKAQRDAIGSPADGLIIYQTNSTPGLYYYNTAWKAVSAAGANKALSNLANVAINAELIPSGSGTLSLGSSGKAWKDLYVAGTIYNNGKPTIQSVSDAQDNILLGTGAGINITTGIENVALGNSALNQNQTGEGNIAIGKATLFFNTAFFNTAAGDQSMLNNTTGSQNSAFGYHTLFSNTAGINNAAFGYSALSSNNGIGLDGIYNNAFGAFSLSANTTGSFNSAFGTFALHTNSSGVSNAAFGNNSLYNNTSGDQNTAVGSNSLNGNTTGSWNTAIGSRSLFTNTAQDKNTAIGWSAGDGAQSAASTYLGYNAHASVVVSGSMALGVNATVTASNQVRIGTNAVTSIGGYVTWSNISDGRVKKNIKSNVPGLAFINKLNPVTYNLDLDAADKIMQVQTLKDKDGKTIQRSAEESTARKAKEQIIYTGFVAQDVEKIAKQIGYDFSGVDAAKNDKDLYGLRYSDFVVPLVKAVQELSEQNNEKDKLINELNNKVKSIEDKLDQILQQKNISAVTHELSNDKSVLEQNVPNPFNDNTTIKYKIPASSKTALLTINNTSGQLFKTINITTKGTGQVNLAAKDLPAGTYFYTLIVDGVKMHSNKMVLIK